MKRFMLLMALLLLAAAPSVRSQGWNISLISTLPDSETVHGVAITDNFAYTLTTAATSKLHIINVTNQMLPSETGSMPLACSFPYALAVRLPYAYIAGGSSGLIIANISDSSQPYAVANSPGLAGNVTLDGDYAYVVNGILAGLNIINVADPLNPIPTGYISVEPEIATSLDVAVANGYAYLADGVGLLVLDVSEPANPVRASNIVVCGSDVRHVALYGGHTYVSSMQTVTIFDITNPQMPIPVGEFTEDFGISGLEVTGDHLFLAEGPNGFKVYSLVDDPVNPMVVGSYNTDGLTFDLRVSGSNAYVADGSGLGIYDCSQALPVIFIPEPAQPKAFAHQQNYPNPFNPTTTISYQLPTACQVKLDVFDTSGRLVSTLVNGRQEAGNQTVVFDGSHLSSGIYFYQLSAGKNQAIAKMALIK